MCVCDQIWDLSCLDSSDPADTEPYAGDDDCEDDNDGDEDDDDDDDYDGDNDEDEDEADISFVWIELIRQTLRGVLLRYTAS